MMIVGRVCLEWSSNGHFMMCMLLFGLVLCGNLFVNPQPGLNNVIKASIESSFVISCVSTGSEEDRPKALQWRSPSNRIITADSNQRVYTILTGDTLRLFFDNLLPSDAGTYTCIGVEAGVPREVRVDLILQSMFFDYLIDVL